MSKLLSANFTRLSKDKIFYILVIGMFLYSVVRFIPPNFDPANITEFFIYQEEYFNFTPMINFFILVFSSLFIGSDYNDGTLRNKIIIGHSRTNIYLANFITTFFVGMVITGISLIVGLIYIPIFGYSFEISGTEVLIYIAVTIGMVAVFCAIDTLVAMVCASRTFILLITATVYILLIMTAAFFDNALNAPELLANYILVDDAIVMDGAVPNPAYLSGSIRDVYEFILLILPTGHALKLAWIQVTEPIIMLVFSVVNTVVITMVGIYKFNKKQLK